MELIARDAPLTETLDFVARFIESQATDLRCSVLILEGRRLRHGAGPSLPAQYTQAIDGVEIGPSTGSCGTAAFTGETVIVEDIAVDPLWVGYSELALSHGLRACWSTPIHSSRGAVLGTFALYYPWPGPPREDDWHLVTIATHLTAIAIERHHTDEALKQQADALAEANLAKDRFLATLSHELRNPLAPLLTAVEVMRLANFEPVQVERCCAIVDRQARQLAHLVDDLLDIARITNRKIELSRRFVNVTSLIAAAREASVLIDERGHEFIVELPSAPLELCVDPGRMIQVLSNLLNNAAKYTDPGGRLRVSAERVDDQIVIRVVDSGHGIDADRLADVFEPFTQVERLLDRSQGGLGVGLAVARSLVELHGGRIEAHSEGPGMGTEITIRLPAVAGDQVHDPEPQRHSARKTARRILVVDDNVDAAELMAECLSMVGHETRVVYDGLSALAMVDEWAPEVVFLDIGLPGISGYEVARGIRQAHPDVAIKLVAMSGYGQPADISLSEAAGIDAHFVKPVDLETLIRAIEDGGSSTGDRPDLHPGQGSSIEKVAPR